MGNNELLSHSNFKEDNAKLQHSLILPKNTKVLNFGDSLQYVPPVQWQIGEKAVAFESAIDLQGDGTIDNIDLDSIPELLYANRVIEEYRTQVEQNLCAVAENTDDDALSTYLTDVSNVLISNIDKANGIVGTSLDRLGYDPETYQHQSDSPNFDLRKRRAISRKPLLLENYAYKAAAVTTVITGVSIVGGLLAANTEAQEVEESATPSGVGVADVATGVPGVNETSEDDESLEVLSEWANLAVRDLRRGSPHLGEDLSHGLYVTEVGGIEVIGFNNGIEFETDEEGSNIYYLNIGNENDLDSNVRVIIGKSDWNYPVGELHVDDEDGQRFTFIPESGIFHGRESVADLLEWLSLNPGATIRYETRNFEAMSEQIDALNSSDCLENETCNDKRVIYDPTDLITVLTNSQNSSYGDSIPVSGELNLTFGNIYIPGYSEDSRLDERSS